MTLRQPLGNVRVGDLIGDLGLIKEKDGGFYKKTFTSFYSDIVKKHYLNVIFIMKLLKV